MNAGELIIDSDSTTGFGGKTYSIFIKDGVKVSILGGEFYSGIYAETAQGFINEGVMFEEQDFVKTTYIAAGYTLSREDCCYYIVKVEE
jgi:hypothetical protein